jgi:hypothetical protein
MLIGLTVIIALVAAEIFFLYKQYDNATAAALRVGLYFLVIYKISETLGEKNLLEKIQDIWLIIPALFFYLMLLGLLLRSMWRMRTSQPEQDKQSEQTGSQLPAPSRVEQLETTSSLTSGESSKFPFPPG